MEIGELHFLQPGPLSRAKETQSPKARGLGGSSLAQPKCACYPRASSDLQLFKRLEPQNSHFTK